MQQKVTKTYPLPGGWAAHYKNSMQTHSLSHEIHSIRTDLLRTEYALLLLKKAILLEHRHRHFIKADDDPDGDWDDSDHPDPGDAPWRWQLGRFKPQQKWDNQMRDRGWTKDDITKALAEGKEFPAPNNVNPGNEAIRYELSPNRFVVRDEVTKDILQISKETDFIASEPK